MKKELKGFICGCIVTTLVSGISLAAGTFKSIDVLENDITVMVDGEVLNSDNFVYNDRTYLPLRAIAEAVGRPVDYDEATNTAYIGEKPVSNIAAITVGDQTITDEDITYYITTEALSYGSMNGFSEEQMTGFNWDDPEFASNIKEKAILNAVNEAVMISMSEKHGIALSDEDKKAIDNEIENLKSSFGEEGAVTRAKTIGIGSLAQYKKVLTDFYITNKVLSGLSNNPDEYMPEDISLLNPTLPRNHASVKHILFLTNDEGKSDEQLALANSVLAKIKSGESFDELLKQYNEDTGEPASGYTFGPGEMVKEFEEASFALNLNQVSSVIKSPYGFHIIKRIPGYYDLAAYLSANTSVETNNNVIDSISISSLVSDVFSAYNALSSQQ